MGTSSGPIGPNTGAWVLTSSTSIRIDRNAAEPLYQQIAGSIRARIREGRLRPGVKLPATRTVAKELAVHRRTVIQAFELLMKEGWLVAGVGQGTFVSESVAPTLLERTRSGERESSGGGRPRSSASDSFSWESHLRHRSDPSPIWSFLSRNRPNPEWIRFTGATADPKHFPADDFRSELDGVLRELGPAALDYGEPEGILPLREWVRDRLTARGLSVEADQVLIVNGSQQGLDLIARLLVTPGEDVLVEEPGYSNGFRVFQANGARTIGVPMDEGGLELAPLARILREASPRFLYLMPNFQNPTGLCLDPERVTPLLDLCRRSNLALIEDQFDGDLVYEGDTPRPIKSFDRDGQVVLLGSFSKILFPGLRLGWLILPKPLLGPMRDLKQVADFSSGLLVQHAMERFCRRGLLDRHLERVRGIYGRRLRCVLDAMERMFPPEVTWTRPRGGLTLWVTLPEGLDALELLESVRAEGVDFSPGFLFFPNGGGTRNLRLSYVRESEERIEQGIGILARGIKQQMSSRPRVASGRPFF